MVSIYINWYQGQTQGQKGHIYSVQNLTFYRY